MIPSCTDWLVGVIGLKTVGKPLSYEWVFRPELFAKITGLAPGAPVTEAFVAAGHPRPGDHERLPRPSTPHLPPTPKTAWVDSRSASPAILLCCRRISSTRITIRPSWSKSRRCSPCTPAPRESAISNFHIA